VQQLRLSQRKNALSLLLLSQAVPFILSGDECGHSAGGNNNAYCQDNKVNWLNWKPDKNGEALLAFTKELIAFRREHPILHSHRLMRLMDYESCGYPDLSYHGEQAWYARFENYNRHLGMMYCGMYEKKADGNADDFIYIAMNMHWITHEFALPILPPDFAWTPAYSTRETGQSTEELCADGTKMIEAPPRSIMVLTGKRLTETKPARRKKDERKSDESITAL
jgi:glycogen operon protein